jgi:Spy/CpxP family protein refolding chaperone
MTALLGRRLFGAALLAAIFLAGALSGAAIDRTLSRTPERHTSNDRDQDRRRSYIIDRVEMAQEQRAAIDSILERRSERMRSIWGEVRPRLDAVTDSARAEIMEVLTPEQRAEYEQRLTDRHRARSDPEPSEEETGEGSDDGR